MSLTVGKILGSGRETAATQGVNAFREVPDKELVQCLVSYGQPLQAATELYSNPHLRLIALRFWSDVQDANSGDKQAKQRVDYIRAEWNDMRKSGMIGKAIRPGVELI